MQCFRFVQGSKLNNYNNNKKQKNWENWNHTALGDVRFSLFIRFSIQDGLNSSDEHINAVVSDVH